MSLDKAIKAGKEHRKPYRGSKAHTCSCRNHGSCSWCLSNRTHANKKRMQKQLSNRVTHFVGDGCCDFCGGHGQNCAKCDNRGREDGN